MNGFSSWNLLHFIEVAASSMLTHSVISSFSQKLNFNPQKLQISQHQTKFPFRRCQHCSKLCSNDGAEYCVPSLAKYETPRTFDAMTLRGLTRKSAAEFAEKIALFLTFCPGSQERPAHTQIQQAADVGRRDHPEAKATHRRY